MKRALLRIDAEDRDWKMHSAVVFFDSYEESSFDILYVVRKSIGKHIALNNYSRDVYFQKNRVEKGGRFLSHTFNVRDLVAEGMVALLAVSNNHSVCEKLNTETEPFALPFLTTINACGTSCAFPHISTSQQMELIMSDMKYNIQTKMLVVGGLQKWQKILLQVKAYEMMDLIVFSRDSTLEIGYPFALEADLNHSCSCSPQGEYIVWRSFTIGDGFQSLLPVAIWGNDTGLLPMRPILLTNPTLRVPLIKLITAFMHTKIWMYETGYRFLIPPKTSKDRKPGYNWTEAIELLMRGEADMIPFMPMNLQHDAIEFTRPIAYTSQGMLVSSPKEPSRAFMYFRFYQKEVWISLLMTTFTVTFIMKKMIRCPASIEKPMSYFRCFWLIFGSLLQQGSPQLPRTSSCRIILATWWLSVIVITTTYSGNLVAFLISNQKEYIVNSLEELPNHKTVKLAINEESAIWENIKVPQNELFKRIHKIYWKNPNRFLSYTSETWNKNILIGVAEGNTVLIDDINTLNEERTKHNKNDTLCDFAFVPEQFASMPLAFGLRKGSSLLQSINNE
ncbi:Ionotropic receptor 93a like protein [Argiope bruennichi]|uniref:Ionotropic receptor 93a like protein n=1 Tax=Argiope bruennichi TaxID=94029 RepID=A0A8T0FSS0_ARGBR|nr:Ionotropic receptor 93a like protein [Argiope bruennichi]